MRLSIVGRKNCGRAVGTMFYELTVLAQGNGRDALRGQNSAVVRSGEAHFNRGCDFNVIHDDLSNDQLGRDKSPLTRP